MGSMADLVGVLMSKVFRQKIRSENKDSCDICLGQTAGPSNELCLYELYACILFFLDFVF